MLHDRAFLRKVIVSRPATRLVCFAVAAIAVLSSCSSSGYAYLKSPDTHAFFKVPRAWHLYDKRQILIHTGQSLSPATEQAFPWLVAVDGNPRPSLDEVLDKAAALKFPAVVASVQRLSFDSKDQLSPQTLRNSVYPLDNLLRSGQAELLGYQDITLPGGYHGTRMQYNVILKGISGVENGNLVIHVDQTALVDPSLSNLYQFYLRCESHCYRDNKSTIDQIVASWTIKER
jgi:hypothetical protein